MPVTSRIDEHEPLSGAQDLIFDSNHSDIKVYLFKLPDRVSSSTSSFELLVDGRGLTPQEDSQVLVGGCDL